ncbi:MAG: ankyrin repeat domain-containing protein [Rickettsiaceae bacterium]|nr:ankyrin repeat domain-containing protein [Rickettsiaceae bacterium]
MEKDADPNVKNRFGQNPLHIAAEKGHLEIAKLLLEKDADLNAQDHNGLTALHIATADNNVELAKLLLEKDSNPNVISYNGNHPLHIAAHFGNKEIVTLLLNYQADINVTNNLGYTPLDLVKTSEEVFIIFLNNGGRFSEEIADDIRSDDPPNGYHFNPNEVLINFESTRIKSAKIHAPISADDNSESITIFLDDLNANNSDSNVLSLTGAESEV